MINLVQNGMAKELLIYGDIGGGFFGDGVQAKSVVEDLATDQRSDILVRINSYGGLVDEGIAIFNALRSRPGKVTVRIEGLAASIASYIAMAADPGSLEIASNSELMIHDAISPVGGNPQELEKKLKRASKISNMMAQEYAKRSGKDVDEVRAKMQAETYFSAEEAVAFGLADRVVDFEPEQLAATAKDIEFMRKHFRRVPNVALQAAARVGDIVSSPPITAPLGKEQQNMELKAMIASNLGLDAAVDDQKFVAALTSIKEENAALVAQASAAESRVSELETAVGSQGEAAIGAIKAFKASHEALGPLKDEIESLREAATKEAHELLVNSAHESGKLTAAEKAWALGQSTETVQGFLEARGDASPIPQPAPSGEPAPTNKLTPEQERLCAQAGLTPEQFLEAAKAGKKGDS